MNILYLLNYAGHGGTEQYVRILAEAMKETGDSPMLAYNMEGKLSQDFSAEGVPVHRLVMKHPLDLAAAWRLAKLCRREQVEVIHTQFLRENYIAVLSRLFNPGVQVVYTNHVMLRNNLPLKVLNRLITPFNHRVIAVCKLGKEILVENKVPAKRITVIHNGVDQQAWEAAAPSTLRQELGIDEDTFVITCLSRFDEFKGNRLLIEAIAAFKRRAKRSKVLFVLANEGPLWEEMQALAKELGVADAIRFIGFRKDVKNVLAGSDLYVNPSEWEALSFAILEAISASLPVVSTNTGGTPDIINEETGCGILVPYGDPDRLADAMVSAMSDKELYNRMKLKAKETARSRFGLTRMVRRTYETYHDKKDGKS